MKVVILEDEPLAAEKLVRYLQKFSKDTEVLKVLTSLFEAIPWIEENQAAVDLFFMDIQLTDGLSFEIFAQVPVKKPVVFTTAYDEFAIDAFKVNSIDYLLKPITFTDLSKALHKFNDLKTQFNSSVQLTEVVAKMQRKTYKDRFLVKIGNHLHSIPTTAIAYFFAEGRDVYLCTSEGRKYLIEYTLESLEELIDPHQFFRINRGFIVRLNAIKDVLIFSNRRLKLTLTPAAEKEVVVSREKVKHFKKWFEGIAP